MRKVSCHLIFSSFISRLDEIQDHVILSSRLLEVDLIRYRIMSSRSSSLLEVDLMQIQDHVISSSLLFRSRLDEIQYLVISSSRLLEVVLMRSSILSSHLLFFQKSTWWDPGSCHLIFSSFRRRLDEIQDLVISSFRLL